MATKEVIYNLIVKGTDTQVKSLSKIEAQLKAVTETRNKLITQEKKYQQLIANEADIVKKEGQEAFNIRKKELKLTEDQVQKLAQLTQQQKVLRDSKKDLNQETKHTINLNKSNANTLDRVNAELAEARVKIRSLVIGSKEFKKAAANIKRLEDAQRKANKEMGRGGTFVGEYAKGAIDAFKKIGIAVAGAMVVVRSLSRLFGGIVSTITEYDQAMQDLNAITLATAEETKKLDTQAKKLGATTIFTATEVVGLEKSLAKLGFTSEAIIKGSGGILALASAMDEDLAQSAKVTGSTIRQFGLEAEDMNEVVDIMTLSFARSALDLGNFENAMSKAGPIAKQYGFSLAETTGFIGELMNAGFEASMAGTAFRNIMLNLADSSGALAQKLGGAVGSSDELLTALEQLKDEGVDLNEILQLTDRRSAGAFATFLDGTKTTRELIGSLRDAGGTAQRMADIQLQSVQSRMKLLNSAWQGWILSMDSGNGLISKTIKGVANLGAKFLGLITHTEDSYKSQRKLINQNIASAGYIQDLSDEYEILQEKGLNKTAAETERLTTVVNLLKLEVGENTVSVNSETGAFEINTKAVEDNIKAKLDLAAGGQQMILKGASETTEKLNKNNEAIEKYKAQITPLQEELKKLGINTSMWGDSLNSTKKHYSDILADNTISKQERDTAQLALQWLNVGTQLKNANIITGDLNILLQKQVTALLETGRYASRDEAIKAIEDYGNALEITNELSKLTIEQLENLTDAELKSYNITREELNALIEAKRKAIDVTTELDNLTLAQLKKLTDEQLKYYKITREQLNALILLKQKSDGEDKKANEEALKLKEKTNKEILRLEKDLIDFTIAAEKDGLTKKLLTEQARHDLFVMNLNREKTLLLAKTKLTEEEQKKLVLINQVIEEEQIKHINNLDLILEMDTDHTKKSFEEKIKIEQDAHKRRLEAAGLYGKESVNLTEKQLQQIAKLNKEHAENLVEINEDDLDKQLEQFALEFEQERTLRLQAYADEITGKDLTEKEKKDIADEYRRKELLAEAKKVQDTINLLQERLVPSIVGLDVSIAENIMSEEDKTTLLKQIEELKQQLIELGIAKDDIGTDEEGNKVGIFGLTDEDLQTAFQGAAQLGDLMGAVFSQRSAANKADLAETKAINDQKKKDLKERLDAGALSEESYNKQIQALDEATAKKKNEIAKKEDRRRKLQASYNVVLQTAQAIMGFLVDPSGLAGTILSIAAGVTGLAQIAAINSAKIPTYAKGGQVKGSGTDTSDNIPIYASPNEFIVNAAAMKSKDTLSMTGTPFDIVSAINARGYATGGSVTPISRQADMTSELIEMIVQETVEGIASIPVINDVNKGIEAQRTVQIMETEGVL